MKPSDDLATIRRFNQIDKQLVFTKFLILVLGGLMLALFVKADWFEEKQEPIPWCGVVESVSPKLKTPNYLLGETLFKANCTSCHKIHDKLVGPALVGLVDKYEKKWLYEFIRDSQKMVQEGDLDAVAVYNEYNGSVMTAFPRLTNHDIDAILEYIEAHR